MTTPTGENSPERPVEPKPKRPKAPAESSSPGIVHGLAAHSLSLREQLMRQWPGADWETRGE